MTKRGKLHARMMAILKDNDYGYVNAQPSRTGLSWVIVNELWSDFTEIDHLRAKIAILVRNARDLPLLDVYAELLRLVDDEPEIQVFLDKITPGGDQ